MIAGPIALSHWRREFESRKRKPSSDSVWDSSNEESWAMIPAAHSTSHSSSEEALTFGFDEEESKDDIFDIYQSMVDVLLRTPGDESHQLARRHLSVKLNQYDPSKHRDIRYRLVKNYQNQNKIIKDVLGLSCLLDIALDEDMNEIEVSLSTYDDGKFEDRILEIVLQRCPRLRTLHLNCSEQLVKSHKFNLIQSAY